MVRHELLSKIDEMLHHPPPEEGPLPRVVREPNRDRYAIRSIGAGCLSAEPHCDQCRAGANCRHIRRMDRAADGDPERRIAAAPGELTSDLAITCGTGGNRERENRTAVDRFDCWWRRRLPTTRFRRAPFPCRRPRYHAMVLPSTCRRSAPALYIGLATADGLYELVSTSARC